MPGAPYGLYRHEGTGRGPHHQLQGSLRLHLPVRQRPSHLGHPEDVRAGGMALLHGPAARDGRGAVPFHREGKDGADRRFLPGLRLLHALSRRHRDQQLRPHVPDGAARALRAVAERALAGKYEEDRGLPALRPVHGKMSLRAEHAGASSEEL